MKHVRLMIMLENKMKVASHILNVADKKRVLDRVFKYDLLLTAGVISATEKNFQDSICLLVIK